MSYTITPVCIQDLLSNMPAYISVALPLYVSQTYYQTCQPIFELYYHPCVRVLAVNLIVSLTRGHLGILMLCL